MDKLPKLKINFYKIAKEHEISMSFSIEKLIEVIEKDKSKIKSFVRDIKKVSPQTKVTDLIANNQYIDINGNDVSNSKSLYLVDYNYYKRLISEDIKNDENYIKGLEMMKESQISMFV